MWLSGMGDPLPFIQYEFDRAYKLHEMWVWNSNQLVEGFVGLGAKDVAIEYSTHGTDWTALEDVPQFAQAPGQDGYAHNTTIALGGVLAKYVKLTINAGYGLIPQYGLSEVRFLYIPTFAREYQPADGAAQSTVDVVLNWRAGREAGSHEVYLGMDPNALTLAATTQASTYQTLDLAFSTTYDWQIVEVNDAEDPASYAGDVQSFTTPDFAVVDNFDQYDNACNRIFFAWADGLGHNGGTDIDDCDVPPSNGNGGGSIVGNAVAPFAEGTIVRAGSSQSMPFSYDNSFGLSEATLTFPTQDWTAHGIRSLCLFFYGDPGNYRYHGSVDRIFGPASSSWVHLGVTCDGVQTRLYYNGILSVTLNAADLDFSKLGIGVNRNEDNWFGGVIDEVKVYDRALSSAEMAGLAELTQPVDIPFAD